LPRYYPVANLTRTRQAVLIEPLRPEKFYVKTFNATSLYILSICEVCGSYQCPYCPFYSAAPPGLEAPSLLSLLLLLVIAHGLVASRLHAAQRTTRSHVDGPPLHSRGLGH
jgi:CD109 antigen